MAGSVLSVGILICLSSVTIALAGVAGAGVASQRASGAADAAALAAADAASGAVTGEPCARAAEVAASAGAAVIVCEVAGLTATVSVQSNYLGLPVSASARAAPPDTPPDTLP